MKFISLTQDKFAKVDNKDFKKLSSFKWFYSEKHGACAGSGRKLMHRIVLNAPKYLEVDHLNGDKLDNRRKNIRLCTHAENMRNRKVDKSTYSGFKGVRNNHGKWQAYINFENKFIYLGNYSDKKKAARAYNKAAKMYFRDFAKLNEI